jgi:hypothetical protein
MLNKQISDKLVSTFKMSFITDHVWGGNNTPFIRFGYWYRVDLDTLKSIIGNEYIVKEDSLDDDDCGTLWCYKLYEKYKG